MGLMKKAARSLDYGSFDGFETLKGPTMVA